MEIRLKKQPQKYLASVDANTREKLNRALEKIKELDGDIVCIKNFMRKGKDDDVEQTYVLDDIF